MAEKPFTGMTHQLGKEFLQMHEGVRLAHEIRRWRDKNPNGTVSQFIDSLVKAKLAIRLDEHPGFVMRLQGW